MQFTHPGQQIVLQDYVDAVADAEARVERLTRQIADHLPTWSLAPVMDAVQAMRGVGFIVAVTVVAEVGDLQRFGNPRQLMAYLVLTPSEHSSGSSVRRGGITKADSKLARRTLIKGPWSYRMQARISPKLLARLEALPQAVRDIAWKGQLRMCQRYRHLMAAGKAKVVVTTAIAREMVAFIWAIAKTVTAAPACKTNPLAEANVPDHADARGWGRNHGEEPSSPVMGRQSRCPILRARQPQDETTVMRQPSRA